MKTIILCGGIGTRMKEETEFKPKPLVSIGGKPIMWHIMKIYAHYGFNEFILALGYKGDMIRDYFLRLPAYNNDFTFDSSSPDAITFHSAQSEPFKITFVDTGNESLTGERILRVKKYIPEDTFMVTYGDGLADIPLTSLVDFHHAQGTIGTLTAVRPHSKYGLLDIDHQKKKATQFVQKPIMKDFVSGGFMVFNRRAFDYFDEGIMENSFPKLIREGELSVYMHHGFWASMDTYWEMEELNKLWKTTRPWAVWEQ